MPHVITRYMAARDDREVQRLQVIAMLWGVAVFYGAGVVGLVGRVMLPDLADGEQALMALALELVHPVLAGVLLAAVISAILSTVSSQLLVAASAVSYDVVEETLGKARDDRRSLMLGRITVVVVGVIGVLVALTEVRLVFWFVLFAWSGLGAAFAPLILLALTKNAVNRHGALAAMLTGAGVTVLWNLGRDPVGNAVAFARSWWIALLAAVAILVIGGSREHLHRPTRSRSWRPPGSRFYRGGSSSSGASPTSTSWCRRFSWPGSPPSRCRRSQRRHVKR